MSNKKNEITKKKKIEAVKGTLKCWLKYLKEIFRIRDIFDIIYKGRLQFFKIIYSIFNVIYYWINDYKSSIESLGHGFIKSCSFG